MEVWEYEESLALNGDERGDAELTNGRGRHNTATHGHLV